MKAWLWAIFLGTFFFVVSSGSNYRFTDWLVRSAGFDTVLDENGAPNAIGFTLHLIGFIVLAYLAVKVLRFFGNKF